MNNIKTTEAIASVALVMALVPLLKRSHRLSDFQMEVPFGK